MNNIAFDDILAAVDRLTPDQLARLQQKVGCQHYDQDGEVKPSIRNRRSQRAVEYREFLRIMAEESEYVRTILDLSTDMIVSVNDDRGIHVFNKAAQTVYGYTSEEVRGRPVNILYADPEEARRVAEGMRLHGAFTGEISSRRKNGEIFPLRITASVLHDVSGAIVGAVGYSRDLTAERKAEEVARQYTSLVELKKLQQDVERMTRHDLKSPLNGIVGFTDLLLTDKTLAPDHREYAQSIMRASQKLLRLINLGVDVFKMEQGTFQLEPTAFNLLPILKNVYEDNAAVMRFRALSWTLSVDGQPPGPYTCCMVLGEESLCYSLFSNLVKNAVEASPNDRPITLSLETRDQTFLVKVHNLGVVPETLRATFFEKYSTMGKRDGLGLGTYSARLMVLAQRGTLTMETSEERGTTLLVELPRVTTELPWVA